MTAGSNGTPEPENDDPFAYLYRGEAETAQADRPGIPRTSYNKVTRVGERRPAAPQGGYGYPQQGYGQQSYAQPGPSPQPAAPGGHRGGHGGQGGSNRRGLMLGAIAVVVVVAIGIGVAAMTGNDKSGKQAAGGANSPSPGATQSQAPSAAASTDPNTGLPQEFAASLTLGGGAKTDNNHQKAQGPNGTFVDGMETPGASAAWTAKAPKAGSYVLWVRYANAQPDDAKTTVVVNGKPLGWKLNLKDYGTPGNWDQWFTSYVTVQLSQGANTIALTCAAGDVCHYNLDRVGLSASEKEKPLGWS